MIRAWAIVVFTVSSVANAQTGADTAQSSSPVLQRARQLFADGRIADARRLTDSLLRVSTPDAAVYADALYLRASNAATAADAERDYRRILIETPLSVRAEDAMLKLADLKEARGDRRGASDHLERFLLSYARHPARPRVALSLVRLLFEQGPQQVARACEALRGAREEVPSSNAEMRNQLEYYGPRCAYAETATPPADTALADTTPPRTQPTGRPAARRETPAPRRVTGSHYSVQVAAYDSPEPARRLVELLQARGIEARVDGTTRPFRVRVGRYASRAEAVRMHGTLKTQGYNGFIALVR
jgi:cell division septation protein DedD